jgi:hypothetical protein
MLEEIWHQGDHEFGNMFSSLGFTLFIDDSKDFLVHDQENAVGIGDGGVLARHQAAVVSFGKAAENVTFIQSGFFFWVDVLKVWGGFVDLVVL